MFDQAMEIAMGAPTCGVLKITEKKSGNCVAELSSANGSFVWAEDSSALAFPRWTRKKMQQLVVLRLPEGKTEPQEGEFRVLELASFDKGMIAGVDSPIHRPAKVCVTAQS